MFEDVTEDSSQKPPEEGSKHSLPGYLKEQQEKEDAAQKEYKPRADYLTQIIRDEGENLDFLYCRRTGLTGEDKAHYDRAIWEDELELKEHAMELRAREEGVFNLQTYDPDKLPELTEDEITVMLKEGSPNTFVGNVPDVLSFCKDELFPLVGGKLEYNPYTTYIRTSSLEEAARKFIDKTGMYADTDFTPDQKYFLFLSRTLTVVSEYEKKAGFYRGLGCKDDTIYQTSKLLGHAIFNEKVEKAHKEVAEKEGIYHVDATSLLHEVAPKG